MKTSVNFITARKRSLGQGNVFTPVYHSVHRGGWLPSMHHRSHDRGEEGQPPRGSPFRGVCIQGVGQTLPMGYYGIQAGGTHPTGMHYCLTFLLVIRKFDLFIGSGVLVRFSPGPAFSPTPQLLTSLGALQQYIYETMFLRNLRSLFWLVCHSN